MMIIKSCALREYPPSLTITFIYHKYNLPILIGLSCCFNEDFNSDDDNKILSVVFISKIL